MSLGADYQDRNHFVDKHVVSLSAHDQLPPERTPFANIGRRLVLTSRQIIFAVEQSADQALEHLRTTRVGESLGRLLLAPPAPITEHDMVYEHEILALEYGD